jgi:hypothetical protein
MNALTIPEVDISKVIEYRIKSVYGRENKYVSSNHACWIKTLTRKETIDTCDMIALEALGFTFTRVF